MRFLRERKDIDELLDQPGVSRPELDRSLSDLEWTNRWLRGRNALLPHVLPALKPSSSLLDAACGSGDMLRVFSDEGRRKGLDIYLVGMDINPGVLAIARQRSEGHEDISWVEGNALSLPFQDCSFDLVISSTFLHHLNPDDAVSALREAARVARRRVVISDLVRSDLALIGIWIIGKLLFGRISRYDGVASVQRAYRPRELAELARRAGLTGARVRSHIFYRMSLVYDKE